MKNDAAYNNVDYIPDGPSYPERWAEAAAAFRTMEASIGRARLNDPYGPGPRQQMDIFHPAGAAEGLVVFVHGGYWMKFDRSYWSHLAAGCTRSGWAVAMPSYTLAPEARISEITAEIAQALVHAAGRVAGPMRLAGHSAGGHLVGRMLCDDVELPQAVRDRIVSSVLISPVADLRPLLETSMNETLGLDEAEAMRESPALRPDPGGPSVAVWVGADERPVFLEQAHRLAEAWQSAALTVDAGRHHFDVIEALADADSPLTQTVLGQAPKRSR